MKTIITTHPFGYPDRSPLDLMSSYGIEINLNKKNRKYTQEETKQVLIEEQPDIIIAGTENYSKEILDLIPNLKMISRVGIGFDNVDLEECKKRNIIVTITPDAPANAVSELVIGQMVNMSRKITSVHNDMKNKKWNRYIGKEIKDCKIGIIGFGRIGKLVYEKIKSFNPKNIFVNDININQYQNVDFSHVSSKEKIIIESDIITIHIPYNKENHHFISKKELGMMKKDAFIINMSRGDIVDEEALYEWLIRNKENFAAIDTFTSEPYVGKLLECENLYLTPHLGSCTKRSRYGMEVGSVEEVIRFLNNEDFRNRIA